LRVHHIRGGRAADGRQFDVERFEFFVDGQDGLQKMWGRISQKSKDTDFTA
jgi:hypothetical protein